MTSCLVAGILFFGLAAVEAKDISLYRAFPEPPTAGVWTAYAIGLNETNEWRMGSVTGAVPTAVEFLTVLSNLHRMEIFIERPAQFQLDNVDWAGLTVSTFSPGCTQDGWSAGGCSSVMGNPPGSISIAGAGAFGAPAKFLGDKSQAYNGSLTFDLWRNQFSTPGGTGAWVVVTQVISNNCECGPLVIIPSADTTLISSPANQNMGGVSSFICGTKDDGVRTRALLRFDMASNLPPEAIVTAVTLSLTDQSSRRNGNQNYALHRLLRDWGEGNKSSYPLGSYASAGEATWGSPFYPDSFWSAPGGAASLDFVSEPSGIIYSNSGSVFVSTSNLVADVEWWRSQPSNNFGWMLLCQREDLRTAQRFASRESESAPRLTIYYSLPRRIDFAEVLGTQFRLRFLQETGHTYAVEFQNVLAPGDWQSATNLPLVTDPSRITVTLPLSGGQRFYRLRMD